MNPNQKIVAQLLGYTVDKITFILNKEFKYASKQKLQVYPQFHREITKIDEKTLKVSLSASFDHPKDEVPFYLDVQLTGTFVFGNWEHEKLNRLAISHCTNALFPYLRTIITTVTANANVPPYIIPIMNSNALFKEKK